MKSRMKGDFHVRFRENVKVKFLCVTRLYATRTAHHEKLPVVERKK